MQIANWPTKAHVRSNVTTTSLTRHVAVLDDVAEDGRVAVMLRGPSDLQRAAADAGEANGSRRGGHICWSDVFTTARISTVQLSDRDVTLHQFDVLRICPTPASRH